VGEHTRICEGGNWTLKRQKMRKMEKQKSPQSGRQTHDNIESGKKSIRTNQGANLGPRSRSPRGTDYWDKKKKRSPAFLLKF